MPHRQADLDRFWAKVEKRPDGCWFWTGDGDGTRGDYGCMFFAGKTQKTHRVSWVIHNGEIPKGSGFHGTCVLHRCDHSRCVNPAHLFLGSQQENVRDRDRKGRQASVRGSMQGQAKLTEAQVVVIRGDKRSLREIAAEYRVDKSLISMIRLNKIWKHVAGLPTTS